MNSVKPSANLGHVYESKKHKSGRPQMQTSASLHEQSRLANSVLAELTANDFELKFVHASRAIGNQLGQNYC